MKFLEDAELVAKSGGVKSESINFFENVVKAATGDLFAAKDALKFIKSAPGLIRDYLFWEKFTLFLNGVFIENDDIRKLSEVFAENEDKEEYSRRVIKIIDDIDTEKKTKYIVNLTRALIMKFIQLPDYYRLCDAIRNTLQEDLEYLNKNISKHQLKDNIHVQFLLQNGLIKQTVIDGNGDNEFEFTRLAYMLDNYGLDYENEEKHNDVEISSKQTIPKTNFRMDSLPTFGKPSN